MLPQVTLPTPDIGYFQKLTFSFTVNDTVLSGP